MSNADPQLEHVDPAHPVAPDAYIRVLNCKSNYVYILAGWFLKDGEKKFYIAEVRGNDVEAGFNRLDWLTEFDTIYKGK
ncbi:hypothetical protein [Acinetobacter baumannii]|uniref:hypothetical protein n=1 Tax=Acinetobacter baumannii TaxID=470 RepID=UPI00111E2314|nr:hypothetical protein [Acinetobacter baumannii]